MAPPRRHREEEVLSFVKAFEEEHKLSPTVREIQEALGFASPFSVQRYLRRLRAEGRLEQEPRRHRGLRVVDDGGDSPPGRTEAHG